MIRINLLAVERGVAKKKVAAGITSAQRVTIGAALILLSTVVTVGWWYWSLHAEGVRLDEEIAKAEVEAQQLRSVLGQVQKFEARKATLQQRVTLIEQLRRGQSGPVHMVDEVSRAVPDRMWLTELTQKGDELTISGMTAALTGVSDFVSNLGASAWFSTPVDIVDSGVVQGDAKTGELVKFTIKAKVKNPEAPAPPVKPAATATAAK
jgi:type IV pilus assembly protein PilN